MSSSNSLPPQTSPTRRELGMQVIQPASTPPPLAVRIRRWSTEHSSSVSQGEVTAFARGGTETENCSMRTLTPKPELGARFYTDRAVKTDISPHSCMKRPYELHATVNTPVIIIGRWHDSSASPIRLAPTFPPPVFARASQSTPWTLTKAMFFFHHIPIRANAVCAAGALHSKCYLLTAMHHSKDAVLSVLGAHLTVPSCVCLIRVYHLALANRRASSIPPFPSSHLLLRVIAVCKLTFKASLIEAACRLHDFPTTIQIITFTNATTPAVLRPKLF
ncbi:uncharacterized protein CLUP02_12495 [Colletotrichum lupini]|uniref:Uncharacterized protein n=1 Tax=Colletotrichum lupini TaxID=145971 RepID=A0A9Q8WKI3_9PEZI|nr:uncharacterized protein CLUP02_12495 [Colletotrichum lupini]UQC86993.1 hypothetical protein CLUP02_12495 [Colletotrichum lupini]